MRFCVLVLIVCVGFVGTARADDPAALVLINEGLALREQGRDADALTLFQRAYEIDASPQALAQIALAEQAVGHWARGYRLLDEAMSHSSNAWIQSRLPALRDALQLARSHVGFVDVRSDVAGTHVWVAGSDAGEAPVRAPVVVDVGDVPVELRRGSTVVAHERVDAVAGEVVAVELSESATSTPRQRGGSALPALGWTSVAIGVAGVGMGVVFQVLRESAVADANRCVTDRGALNLDLCDQSEYDAHSGAANRDGTISLVGYVAGGVLIGAGALLLLLAPHASTHDGLALSCGPTFSNVGAVCVGAF